MINFIIDKLTKNKETITLQTKRLKVGLFAGIIGIIFNILLVVVKIAISFITSSNAVFVDAINNLFDIVSSIVTIISFNLASKPADKEHPYGHGRIEYFASLVVGVIIILIGWDFTKSSFLKIFEKEVIVFSLVPFILLLLSTLVKLFLTYLNRGLAKAINSSTLKASGDDAFNDALISLAVAISILISPLTSFPIDAILGLIVSILIIKSGIDIIKENTAPLIGKAPSQEIIDIVWNEAKKLPHVLNTHDLFINSYGPNIYIATIHMEFPSEMSSIETHDIAYLFEKRLFNLHNIDITVHIDPIDINNKEWKRTENISKTILKDFTEVISSHSHRIFTSPEDDEKYILFDIAYDCKIINTFEKQQSLKENIEKAVLNVLGEYKIDIRLDADTLANEIT